MPSASTPEGSSDGFGEDPIVWSGEHGGLTEDEVAEFARIATSSPEIAERLKDDKRLHFLKWLIENGSVTEWPEGEEPGEPIPRRNGPSIPERTNARGTWIRTNGIWHLKK